MHGSRAINIGLSCFYLLTKTGIIEGISAQVSAHEMPD
jgi:hypothetical protein